MCSDSGWKGARNRQFRSDDPGVDSHGGVAESAAGGIGGDGEHRGLLDRSARSVGGAGPADAAGERPAVSASTGTGQEKRSHGLRMDSAAAQLRITAGLIPTGGKRVHAANSGTG